VGEGVGQHSVVSSGRGRDNPPPSLLTPDRNQQRAERRTFNNGEQLMMNNFMMSFMRDEQGQDLIEYALLAGLISILCVAAITTAGSKVSALWVKVSASIP
jgi:pilus assembly protein Flp/PilA